MSKYEITAVNVITKTELKSVVLVLYGLSISQALDKAEELLAAMAQNPKHIMRVVSIRMVSDD